MPHLGALMNSLYACNYSLFFTSLGTCISQFIYLLQANITDALKRDRFLARHAGFYCKEMKVIAYTQMLESYRSVQLENMASAFGVTAEFLDRYTNNPLVTCAHLMAGSFRDLLQAADCIAK